MYPCPEQHCTQHEPLSILSMLVTCTAHCWDGLPGRHTCPSPTRHSAAASSEPDMVSRTPWASYELES